MTTVAIPHWQGRVSPVFDVAGCVLVAEVEAGSIRRLGDIALVDDSVPQRVTALRRTGAQVLICGAISWPLEMAVAAAGIRVIAQICGGVDDVLAAYAADRLQLGAFLMPGCCGRRRRLRARQGRGGRWQ